MVPLSHKPLLQLMGREVKGAGQKKEGPAAISNRQSVATGSERQRKLTHARSRPNGCKQLLTYANTHTSNSIARPRTTASQL